MRHSLFVSGSCWLVNCCFHLVVFVLKKCIFFLKIIELFVYLASFRWRRMCWNKNHPCCIFQPGVWLVEMLRVAGQWFTDRQMLCSTIQDASICQIATRRFEKFDWKLQFCYCEEAAYQGGYCTVYSKKYIYINILNTYKYILYIYKYRYIYI